MKTRKIMELKPTQFAIGMLEVDEKIKEVHAMSKKERRAFIEETVVPVIKGPAGLLYVVDRHHFLSVCYHLGVEKVRVKIVGDLSKTHMSFRNFWKWMRKNRSAYPYCQFGEGPRNELYLPADIRGLADDPYRSMAWFVRKAGGFENSDKNFAEFQWANFFRKKKLLDKTGMPGFEKALVKAVKLAQSPEARRLPGYGKLNLGEQAKATKKVRRRIRKAKTEGADKLHEALTKRAELST